ncbi:hypothetical protein J4480_06755 [Candidatus Woesearchaeota archaeon]|nr:hypothetical protein [Candidatus Woesearchaeota archaeon]
MIKNKVEDFMELSKEAKANIKQSQKEIKEGKTISLFELKKKIISKLNNSNKP